MIKKTSQLVRQLIKKKITLSVVESCTGGMFSKEITAVSGASKIFKFAVITYSNQSKIKYLKVSSKIIKKYGAVSEECCNAMLVNLSKISKTTPIRMLDICSGDRHVLSYVSEYVDDYLGVDNNEKYLNNRGCRIYRTSCH